MPNPEPDDFSSLPEPAAPDQNQDLQKFVRLVLEKAWLIATCVVLALVAAALYVQRTPRIYESTATVQVEQEDAKVVKVEQVVSEDMRGLEILNTVAQKLCNRELLEQVLDANHLLPPEDGVVSNGLPTVSRAEVVARYAGKVKSALRRNTRLIDITVADTSPQRAALLANGVVENYLTLDARVQQTATTSASSFLRQEADRLKKKLEASDQALQAYRKQVGAISLEQNQDIITPELQDLNKRFTQSKADVAQALGAYQDSLNMSTNIEDLLAYPQVANDPDVLKIAAAVSQAENDFAVIRQRYRAQHPKYRLTESSLAGLREQLAITTLKVRARIQQSLLVAYQNASTLDQGLAVQLHATENSAMQLSESAVKFNVLTREVKSDQALFDSVIARLGETAMAAQIAPERIRLIQPALVPELPSSPKIKIVFAMALFGGLGIGLLLSFMLAAFDSSFHTVEDIEQYQKHPLLGSIPKLPKLKTGQMVQVENLHSPGAEVFRSLRATLSLLGREQERRTYLFTSSLPGEGKTFNSVNYAASLAQQGIRTLVMDLDLRRPMVEEFFLGKKERLPGVTDFFLGRKKFDELLQISPTNPKLSWIPAGTMVPNPSELLAESDFPNLLNEALARFDRVIIDTAPVLPVSDTLLLVSQVQTVVLVVRSCKTPRKAVSRSLQLMEKANAKMGGLILNMLPNRLLSGYYYSYYQGYGYGQYGEEKSKDTDKASKS